MISYTIPGREPLLIEHLVLDYNGTIARDGSVIAGVAERVRELSKNLTVHVITADTFGSVQGEVRGWDVTLHVIKPGNQEHQKFDYCASLGFDKIASIGNGRNDGLMLRESALGICAVNEEGVFTATLTSSDIVTRSIIDALDLLLFPDRLKATLRN